MSTPEDRKPGRRAEALVAAILLAVLLSAALTVDAVHNGYGLKGDEASYTAMALSVAYDGDLAFERKDLERYWAVYTCGPDGVFLKRGKLSRLKLVAGWPFVRFMRYADAPVDSLYFGKAYIYPVAAAPFLRLLGLTRAPTVKDYDQVKRFPALVGGELLDQPIPFLLQGTV